MHVLFQCFRFAKLAAAIFLRCDIPVYLFSKIVPTPFVVSNADFIAGLINCTNLLSRLIRHYALFMMLISS